MDGWNTLMKGLFYVSEILSRHKGTKHKIPSSLTCHLSLSPAIQKAIDHSYASKDESIQRLSWWERRKERAARRKEADEEAKRRKEEQELLLKQQKELEEEKEVWVWI